MVTLYGSSGARRADNIAGVVRNARPNNTPTPPLDRDASGKFTAQSMERLLATLSQAIGKGGPVDALVFDTADIEDAVMEAYLAATTVLQIKILGRSPMASLFPQFFEAPG